MNAGVEAAGDDVPTTVIGGHVKNDIRIFTAQLAKFWCKHGRDGKAREQQANAASSFFSPTGYLFQSLTNFSKGGSQPSQKLFS